MTASLLVLARDSSSDKRHELLRSMADLFIDREQEYSDRELALFGEVVSNLIGQVDLSARIELSHKIADCDRVTGDLHIKLAEDDELLVAEPVLERCRLFDDGSLIEIARRQSQDHLLAISRRERLSEAVTDVLVERGESVVVRTVTGNLGADISLKSYDRIVFLLDTDIELQSAISYRADMPMSVAERVLKTLPIEQSGRLMSLMDEDPDAVVALMGAADAKARSERRTQLKLRQQTKGQTVQVSDGLITLDSLIILLAREDRYQDLTLVFSKFANLKETAVLNALFKIDHSAITVLLRALESSEGAALAVAQLRGRRLNLPNSAEGKMVEACKTLDLEMAEKILRLTRVRFTV